MDRKKRDITLIVTVSLICVIFACSCEKIPEQINETTPVGKTDTDLKDNPLEDFRGQLLDTAFKTATSIAVYPHIKDRSRAQEKVVDAALKLGQPVTVSGYIKKIDNWRRGLCYAKLALYCAENNYKEQANEYLKRAEEIAAQDHGQQWRNDRIKAKIAQTRILLGDLVDTQEILGSIDVSEKGKVAQAEILNSEKNSFEQQLDALDDLIEAGEFDVVKSALNAYIKLYERFYHDPSRRAVVEEKFFASWDPMPIQIRFDLLIALAEVAIDHQDIEKLQEFVKTGQSFINDYQWKLEYKVAMVSRLAVIKYKAGNRQHAQDDLEAMLAFYKQNNDTIINMFRAEAVRPLAEAYWSMGDAASSLSVYKLCVEEGVANPAPWPRAEDLSATCISMALHSVEPDCELWERIIQISEELES